MKDERDDEGVPTYREIGRMLGMSHGTVQNIERRALAKLRAALVGAAPPREKRTYKCRKCGRDGHTARTCG